MKNKIGKIVPLLIMTFGLTACEFSPSYYVDKLEENYGIQYLSDAKIEFFYENISGFDSSGLYYYVLKYEEEPTAFFQQFENNKPGDESDESFQSGKNIDFEEKVNTLINTFAREDYNNFASEYKIDWNKEYLYKNDTPIYVTFPMIYFKNEFRLIIVLLQP